MLTLKVVQPNHGKYKMKINLTRTKKAKSHIYFGTQLNLEPIGEKMDLKATVKELADEFKELQKMEMEFKMRMGKYDEKATALMQELGAAKDAQQVNFIEMLNVALNKSPLIL